MDDSSERPAAPSRIGGLEQLGRYELVCVLSRAEYGSTWACIATAPPNLGRVFSLRRIVVGAGDEEVVAKPILKTAALWEGITRPGILPVVDSVESSGRVGIVGEYAEGEPLRTVVHLARLRKMPMPQPIAFRVATDLIQALVNLIGTALRKPELSASMHGGLLPDVVLLTSSGETRVTEPGVTTEITRIPALMRHEKLIAYQSPEQLSDGKTDARTDVFVVGTMLWEMVAGKPLFLTEDGKADERTHEATRQRVLNAEAPRLDDPSLGVQPAVDKALADLVERCLQKKAASRFPSLQDLATTLRKTVGSKAGTRKEVATYLTELVGSTLETRRAAIERASLSAPQEIPSENEHVPTSAREVVPAGIEVDVDVGDGDDIDGDLDEDLLLDEASGEIQRPPVPPRIEIKSAPARQKWPAAPQIFGDSSKPGIPRPVSPQPPAVAPASTPSPSKAKTVDEAPADSVKPAVEAVSAKDAEAPEAAPKQEPAEPAGEGMAAAPVPNPFEQPFADPAIPMPVLPIEEPAPERAPEGAPEGAPEEPVQPASAVAEEPAEKAELALPFESLPDATEAESASPERKRKMMFIVGGVVGVAALLLLVGIIASSGNDAAGSGTDLTPSATAPVEVTPEAAPVVPEAAPDPTPEAAAPDAAPQQDAAPEAAPPEPTTEPVAAKPPPKPAGGKPPQKYKPKPKPYVPSGI
jgi:serine/threonine-protein kinase